MRTSLKSPFVYFGGKKIVADEVWRRFGKITTYIEPFLGSAAVLLAAPRPANLEVVNDKDCYVANFWRSLKTDPEAVAKYADWPVNHTDLIARHRYLVQQKTFRHKMLTDPEFYDAKIAGWWVWGINIWIGGGWCALKKDKSHTEWRQGLSFKGTHKAELTDLTGSAKPFLGEGGKGVHRDSINKRPHLTTQGMNRDEVTNLSAYLEALAARLRNVRVCCGDWSRICTDFVLGEGGGTAGIFLDPPYAKEAGRDNQIYSTEDLTVAHEVRAWAVAHGDNPKLRIALCGYEGEHEMPKSWFEMAWKTQGGYGVQSNVRGRANRTRERIWFSPFCMNSGFGSFL